MTSEIIDETASADSIDRRRDSEVLCIVGLGYVGLPLATTFDEAGYDVIGYDVDESLIESLRRDEDPTNEIGGDRLAELEVEFVPDPVDIERADYVFVTVPTPLDSSQNPELEFVRSAARTIGEHLSEGTTVVLESTVYPGVTRNVLQPTLAEASGLTPGEEFNVGYSPERLSPGDGGRGIRDAVKIVSGDSESTLANLSRIYGSIIDAGVHEAASLEVAEAAKVLENVQRDLNIALMNEVAIICENLDIDTKEVIEAAGTKWNFHEYSPGLVGGHCIPVDPLYLVHGSERAGFSPKLILQAREINEYMPTHVADLTIRGLNDCGKVIKDTRLLVLGAAYKPNVGDIRTSEVKTVISVLEQYGVDAVVYDPIADDEAIAESLDVETVSEPDYDGCDGIVLATPHEQFYSLDFPGAVEELEPDPVFVDVKAVMDEQELTEAGYEYRCL